MTSVLHTVKSELGWKRSFAGPASTVHFVRPQFGISTTLLLFIRNQLLKVRVYNHHGDVELTSISILVEAKEWLVKVYHNKENEFCEIP